MGAFPSTSAASCSGRRTQQNGADTTDRQADGQTDRRTDGQTDRRTDRLRCDMWGATWGGHVICAMCRVTCDVCRAPCAVCVALTSSGSCGRCLLLLLLSLPTALLLLLLLPPPLLGLEALHLLCIAVKPTRR